MSEFIFLTSFKRNYFELLISLNEIINNLNFNEKEYQNDKKNNQRNRLKKKTIH